MATHARDEVVRLRACLAAIAGQRDPSGWPLASDAVLVVVLANSCRDASARQSTALFADMATELFKDWPQARIEDFSPLMPGEQDGGADITHRRDGRVPLCH